MLARARAALLLCLCLACACGRQQSRDHTPPLASFAAYPASGAAPLRVRFDGTASRDDVGVAEYRWDFGDGSTALGAVADHVYPVRGSYTATLTALDAAGNRGTATRFIEVSAPPDGVAPKAALSAAPLAGTAPLSVHLDGSASTDDTGVAAYVWDLGDGTTAALPVLDHVYSAAGTYSLRLTVRDAAGNSDTAQATVVVAAPLHDTAPPSARLSAAPQAGLAPLRVHLDATGSSDDVGVTRYRWDLGDGRTAEGALQDVSYAVAGRYTITLTVWDGAGHSASAQSTISVEALPAVPDEPIYADALASPWVDWSWATSYSLAASAPVHTGASSVRLTPKSWEGLHFHHATGFDTAGYDRLSLWVNGGAAGGQKLLVAARYSGVLGSSVALEPWLQGGATAIPAGAWAQALVPLSALGAAGKTLEGVIIQDGTGAQQPDVYLDDLTLYPELGGPSVAPCPALPAARAPVSRRGGSLWLGDGPFRAAGANVYYLQSNLANAQQLGNANLLQKARESLDVLVCLGMPVVRTWAFNERTAAQDPASIQPSPGVFREEGLQALDQSIAEAKARGLRVILTLVDNWSYYGGLDRYAAWAGKSHDDFFTDSQMKGWWKAYAAALLARVNTVTGVRYRDEPAILAWELGNEFRCHTCAGSSKLHAAIAELAAYLRSLGPTQLIADGGEGFDDQPSLWSLSNSYPVGGSEGASFSTLSAIPELDLLSYHVYPVSWGLSADDSLKWFDGHQRIAAQGGKVAYPGEYGFQADDATRAAKYQDWNSELYDANGGQLGLLWQILPEGIANNDGFGVYYPSDAATLRVLGQFAALR
jgi:PKD repeat protein